MLVIVRDERRFKGAETPELDLFLDNWRGRHSGAARKRRNWLLSRLGLAVNVRLVLLAGLENSLLSSRAHDLCAVL
jgi:hypothetical protein